MGDDWLRAIDRNQVWLARSNGRLRLRIGEALDAFFGLRGHLELGFSSQVGYALERLSRSGRWASESRTVARRAAELPAIRESFHRGELGWAQLELLCRHATSETGQALLEVARATTVRQLRDALSPRPEGMKDESAEEDAEPEIVTLTRRLPAEEAWALEATLRLVDHVSGGCPPSENVEWLLAEGYSTLICEAPPDVSDLSEGLARRAEESRERVRALAAEQQALEAEVESELLAPEAVEGEAPLDWDAPLPCDVYALDDLLRELCERLASADLWLGKSLASFFAGRQYERLGYATDGQYARERLAMSRSSAWERVRLARRRGVSRASSTRCRRVR